MIPLAVFIVEVRLPGVFPGRRVSGVWSLLDADPRLGYTVQGYISGVYFRRYIETVTKLQAVVHSLPLTSI